MKEINANEVIESEEEVKKKEQKVKKIFTNIRSNLFQQPLFGLLNLFTETNLCLTAFVVIGTIS